jgi:death-on-curing protein
MKKLTIEQVEYLAHGLAVELMDYGEPIPPFATRSPGKLESCLEQPFQTFDGKDLYPSFATKAAALFYFVTKNHAFENGNKRMAVAITLVFLYVNNKWFSIDPEKLYDLAIITAESDRSATAEMIERLSNVFEKMIIDK